MTSATAHRVAADISDLELADYQRAVRLVLRHPLITATWPDERALPRVRRFSATLRRDLAEAFGHRLELHGNTARLVRAKDLVDATQPALSRTGRPFDRRRYAYLALCLAVLGRAGIQITLSELADSVAGDAGRIAGLGLDQDSGPDRRAFVDAVGWLEERGVLRLADGSSAAWASDPGAGEALYDIARDVVFAVFRPTRVLQHIETISALLDRSMASSGNAMDEQMRARRMSSGLTVGVGWRLADDLDPEQREVCRLLERDPARLGPVQLTAMRRHFAGRIKAARATGPERPYRELLGEVLDYRRWRVFAFTLHRPGGATEALTRARHSQLSGGEQSVSLHLPLFAAANALFGSARPDAPRLLGLDEAFAGVDDTGRGELMALAKQFDLDLFMTGYDLWAAHPAVTGAAHYDLSHSAVEHTVSAVLLVWDGTANVADFDGTLARALGSPESRRAPAGPDGTAEDAGAVLELADE